MPFFKVRSQKIPKRAAEFRGLFPHRFEGFWRRCERPWTCVVMGLCVQRPSAKASAQQLLLKETLEHFGRSLLDVHAMMPC